MKSIIDARHIKMKFKNLEALSDVTLTVEENEIFGLLGPSGAGKTTLIKILTGQLTPTSGSANIFACDTTNLNNEIYEEIGMVLDSSGIYPRLSCYDNLLLYVRLHKISKDRITEVLTQVGLEDAIHLTCSKLSKGMTQRLILARAILHHPKLLFLDEPTSGLDPLTARVIHKLIKELQHQGTTVFLTTHNMEEATKLCDHIALLHDGNIVEYGVPIELCRKYDTEHKIVITCHDDTRIELVNIPENANVIAQYFKEDKVKDIHSIRPNLESVFIQLTGKELNDHVDL